jgi:hypothetical protein
MAHTRADATARQKALDRMFQLMSDLERAITEAEAREQRMAGVDSPRRQEMAQRFPAMAGRTSRSEVAR